MTTTIAGQALANGLQPLSCLRCASRKVRCDRIVPCSNCIKHDVRCEFPQPRTERRQRRKAVGTTPMSPSLSSVSLSLSPDKLREKLNRYQLMVKDLGVDVESPDSALGTAVNTPTGDIEALRRIVDQGGSSGRLVVSGNGCRYIEGNMWSRIGEDLTASDVLPGPSGNDIDNEEGAPDTSTAYLQSTSWLTLGHSPFSHRPISTEELYPPEQHFLQLWQAYLSNVHPVTMILHGPSDGDTLAGTIKGRGRAPRDVEALMFAVMMCAIISVADADCVRLFGEKKSTLFSRYRLGCEVALISANFLVSPILRVLQAYTIYLVAIGPYIDPCELWNLTGIARRNAQRLGLHHAIAAARLTPFELEMRKRLWAQIAMLDAESAQTAGLYRPENNLDLVLPNNVSDADLSPGMTDAPKELVGATDMIFCNMRHKLMKFKGEVNGGQKPWVLSADQYHRDERSKEIVKMQEALELEILRYCDLLNPVHYLAVTIGRLTLCKLRYTSLQLCQHGKGKEDCAERDREVIFTTALKILEYYNNVHSHPFARNFLWHTQQHFHWSCLMYILAYLQERPHGEQADTAWKHIHLLYECRPDIYQDRTFKLPVYKSITRMTLEAWKRREESTSECGRSLMIPPYIATLQGQVQSVEHKQPSNTQSPSSVSSSQTLIEPSHDEILSLNGIYAQESAGWPNWASSSMMTSYSSTSNHGMYLHDSMLGQPMPMSVQSHDIGSCQSHNQIPRMDRPMQGGPQYLS